MFQCFCARVLIDFNQELVKASFYRHISKSLCDLCFSNYIEFDCRHKNVALFNPSCCNDLRFSWDMSKDVNHILDFFCSVYLQYGCVIVTTQTGKKKGKLWKTLCYMERLSMWWKATRKQKQNTLIPFDSCGSTCDVKMRKRANQLTTVFF